MTEGYLNYELSHSSSRNTKPSDPEINQKKHKSDSIPAYNSTTSSGKSVVYTQKKTSYRHVKYYVHKPSKDPI